jgi:hypothetical protein
MTVPGEILGKPEQAWIKYSPVKISKDLVTDMTGSLNPLWYPPIPGGRESNSIAANQRIVGVPIVEVDQQRTIIMRLECGRIYASAGDILGA